MKFLKTWRIRFALWLLGTAMHRIDHEEYKSGDVVVLWVDFQKHHIFHKPEDVLREAFPGCHPLILQAGMELGFVRR